jgi:acetate kinase
MKKVVNKKVVNNKENKIISPEIKKNIFKKQKGEKFILISNIGSTSRKYIVYKVKNKSFEELYKMNFDGKEFYPQVKLDEAILKFFELSKKEYNINVSDIDFILERVVAVGEYFLNHKEINEEYLEKLEEAVIYDSIHTVNLIKEIEKILILKRACKTLLSSAQIFAETYSSFSKGTLLKRGP